MPRIHSGTVIGVDKRKRLRHARPDRTGRKAQNPEVFVRPEQFTGGNVSGPTAGVTEFLRLRKIALTATAFVFSTLARGDIPGDGCDARSLISSLIPDQKDLL